MGRALAWCGVLVAGGVLLALGVDWPATREALLALGLVLAALWLGGAPRRTAGRWPDVLLGAALLALLLADRGSGGALLIALGAWSAATQLLPQADEGPASTSELALSAGIRGLVVGVLQTAFGVGVPEALLTAAVFAGAMWVLEGHLRRQAAGRIA